MQSNNTNSHTATNNSRFIAGIASFSDCINNGENDLAGKTALIRTDLNVPMQDGQVVSDVRIRAALPSIRHALNHGAGVLVMSHLGRPKEGMWEAHYSLEPVAQHLERLLGVPVAFNDRYLQHRPNVQAGTVMLLENVRFNHGEKTHDLALAKRYADLCDVLVFDAFATAHRAQASTTGLIAIAKEQGKKAYAGLLLAQELTALNTVLNQPTAPVVAIVGGSKVSSKLQVLHQLADKSDRIIVGGGIANTFLVAQGINVGASLYESALVDSAARIMQKVSVLLPTHVVVANKNAMTSDNFLQDLAQTQAITKSVHDIADDEMILDIDPSPFADALKHARTILWNGPLGVFEVEGFAEGTKRLTQMVAASHAFSVAGGGDTLAAIEKFADAQAVDYLSTGGGAFLEWLEGKDLPAIVALKS